MGVFAPEVESAKQKTFIRLGCGEIRRDNTREKSFLGPFFSKKGRLAFLLGL
jgi:hypothetical protein